MIVVVDTSAGLACPSIVMMTPGEVGFDVLVLAVFEVLEVLGAVEVRDVDSSTGTMTGTTAGVVGVMPTVGVSVVGATVGGVGGFVMVTASTRTNGTAVVVVVAVLRAAPTFVGETKATVPNTSAPPAQPPQMTADLREEAFMVDHQTGRR